MNPLRRSSGTNRRNLVAMLALLPAVWPAAATAQAPSPGGAFSFAVYGDSRPMEYLPTKAGKPDLVKLFVEMFGLVLPEKMAEEVVKKDVKLTFDPTTKELTTIVMPFMSKTEVMTLTVDKGWVSNASVEDVKLAPGVHRTIFRLEGGDWVAREIVKDVQSGRAKFVLNSGDVVWWGNQGRTIQDSPYWKRVYVTPSASFANTIVVLYALSALLGAIVYWYFRVRPGLERDGHWPTLGLFDIKEHFVAIGLALLPAYWICWRKARSERPGRARTAITSLLTFIVWWSFLVGHVANNIRGFGS